ncbi:hypothetical protein PCYB_008190 [Plasmodium cynomolgi strain B]|uniref:CYIR protein n=1 Tax=Plasmodium cynomolgi (strain B) TaxID=1120755 RepID=K6V3W2_PLACD|nr:hypothetical protein PCYB_008190 [Plasmodium cynomolgi strain B]GAB70070.1 hypothetical protein PCYB_008190 [Plasmodium cynomolgi strain B]
MEIACRIPSKTDSSNNVFEPRCATKIFEPFLQHFNTFKDEILNHIKEINDPILKYISVYFVQYYIDGYDYYKYSEKTMRDAACQYLKLWLQEKKIYSRMVGGVSEN